MPYFNIKISKLYPAYILQLLIMVLLIIGNSHLYSQKAKAIDPNVKFYVFLSSNKYSYYEGEVAIIKAIPNKRNLPLEYKFHFGAGKSSGWQKKLQVKHRFKKIGSYEVYVEARLKTNRSNLVQSPKRKMTLKKARTLSRVSLVVSANRSRFINSFYIKPRLPILFVVKSDSTNAEYKFIFGDGKVINWTGKPQFKYAYKRTGNYIAYALARNKASKGKEFKSNVFKIAVHQKEKKEIDAPDVEFKVKLRGVKKSYFVQKKVSIIVRTLPLLANLEYRFDMGDGYKSGWKVNRTWIRYKYKHPGKYKIRVFARRTVKPDKINKYKKAKVLIKTHSMSTIVMLPPKKLVITLEQGSEQIIVNTPFTLNAISDQIPKDPIYKFYFGDGKSSKWINKNTIDHLYSRIGTFKSYVLIAEHQGNAYPIKSSEKDIQVLAKPFGIALKLSRAKAFIGERIQLKAFVDKDQKITAYRFDFGDGTKSGWIRKAFTTHVFKKTGQFKPLVEIKLDKHQVISSKAGQVKVRYFNHIEKAKTIETPSKDISIDPPSVELKPGEKTQFKLAQNIDYKKIFWSGPRKQTGHDKHFNVITRKDYKPGKYTVHIRVLDMNDKVLQSSAVIKIRGMESTSSLLTIIGIVAIIAVAVVSSLFLNLRLSLKVNSKIDNSKIDVDVEGLSIEKTEFID